MSLLARIAEGADSPPPTLSRAALEALSRYGFPGNVRELENILERALALCGGTVIHEEDLLLDPVDREPGGAGAGSGPDDRRLQEYLDEIERGAIGGRCRKPAAIVPQPHGCSASPSVRCATAWSAWA